VATTFALQIGIAILVFLLFSWLRLIPFTRRFYAPKRCVACLLPQFRAP
jgi:hypothetical protein